MAARASLSFDEGMRTVSCMATLALRMRVSMSAIGSVIVIAPPLSPTRLGDAGYLSGVYKLAQADAAHPELPEDGVGPATAAAAGVGPHLVLGLALRLDDERLLGHLVVAFLAERESESV